MTDEYLLQIIDLFDKNGDGEVQYREFCDIFEDYERAEETTDRVLSDLRDRLRAYGSHTDEELRRIFKEFDKNRDGKLSGTNELPDVSRELFCTPLTRCK